MSLSVASLRAYGLDEDLLDELGADAHSGLTFAPEAGTQRMRDVVNKNVTEEQLDGDARARVFSRGWHRMKLYFMIGLPTEEDDDVRGIVETGQRMLGDRPRARRRAAPRSRSASARTCPSRTRRFSGARMDPLDEIARKQRILRDTAGATSGVRLKHARQRRVVHRGLLARGDRRLADVIEAAWRAARASTPGTSCSSSSAGSDALAAHGVDVDAYLGTLPVTRAAAVGPHRRRPRGRLPRSASTARRSRAG